MSEESAAIVAVVRHHEDVALTPHPVLRTRLLTYLDSVGGSASRADVLNALDSQYSDSWTPEDLLPQNTRQFETKWRNRVSFERQRLVEDGLLESRADGIWSLTPTGRGRLQQLDTAKAAWRDGEIARREKLWLAISAREVERTVRPADVRELGIYNGARGIYVDVEKTRSEWTATGAALTFLHLGVRYANEMNSGGVIYHYPSTARAGRDQAEITATERSFALGLPVFVVARAPGDSSRRVVHRAFVEDVDAERGVALITFTDDELPPAPPLSADETPFVLIEEPADALWSRRRARPHQARFAFEVLRRYGARCAICDLSIIEALEAAHLRPKAKRGADDARNGLPLCSNHHRMFDASLFAFDPDTLAVVLRADLQPGQLGITRTSLLHLSSVPHRDALADSRGRIEAD